MTKPIKPLLESIFDDALPNELQVESTPEHGVEQDEMKQDEIAQIDASDRLYAYIDAEVEGRAAATLYPEVQIRLEADKEYRQCYDELKSLILMDRQGELAHPPRTIPVDLSYLATLLDVKAVGLQKPEWCWDETVKQLLIQFSDALLQTLQSPVPHTMSPPVKSAGPGSTLFEYVLSDQVDDLNVKIMARESRSDPEQCTVVVEAGIPSRGGPLRWGGTRVTLSQASRSPQTQVTDAFGKVLFENVDKSQLSTLKFTIMP